MDTHRIGSAELHSIERQWVTTSFIRIPPDSQLLGFTMRKEKYYDSGTKHYRYVPTLFWRYAQPTKEALNEKRFKIIIVAGETDCLPADATFIASTTCKGVIYFMFQGVLTEDEL